MIWKIAIKRGTIYGGTKPQFWESLHVRCIWCDRVTVVKRPFDLSIEAIADREHIFPESVGGIQTLERGKVCQDCNNRLGTTIDRHLRDQNIMMLKQYQDAMEIRDGPIGKVRGKKDRERKETERNKVYGYGGGCSISRDPEARNIIKVTNSPSHPAGDVDYNPLFARALHKCAVNALLNQYENAHVKIRFNRLIRFVLDDNPSFADWSYGISYAHPFSEISFEPWLVQTYRRGQFGGIDAVVLCFPGLLAVVGTSPNMINEDLLGFLGDDPPQIESWLADGFDFTKHYIGALGGDYIGPTYGSSIKYFLLKSGR